LIGAQASPSDNARRDAENFFAPWAKFLVQLFSSSLIDVFKNGDFHCDRPVREREHNHNFFRSPS
jgi:hypothetical protein